MLRWSPFISPLRNPIRSLGLVFIIWKTLLLLIALVSPGAGYDTSTAILLSSSQHHQSPVDRLVQNLVRWDAFYYVKVAERDYLWEQEWAFSWGLTRVIGAIARTLGGHQPPSIQTVALVGICVAHISHFLAVLALYDLTRHVTRSHESDRLAFVTATLHIFSPAGLFLSSPYSEPVFALLNITGNLCYVLSMRSAPGQGLSPHETDVWILAAGLCFGAACTVRGNGLLSGLTLAYHTIMILRDAVTQGLTPSHVRRMTSGILAGFLTGMGAVIPQFIAYRHYCQTRHEGVLRPWCTKLLPSIYSWVQQYYWNNGFLRYWKLSNVPLFIIAAPVMYLLLQWDLRPYLRNRRSPNTRMSTTQRAESLVMKKCLICLMIPQVTLALLALTNFHIQIITRLASGYPLWYMAVAMWLISSPNVVEKKRPSVSASLVVRFMVVYAMVQGALFANFLPPA
ncbi:mannosyltransferase [Pseudovirgaria hyperparasitica]|uniref:GPI mannosyltransferase 2 n=1 Tax=Pseudovirgaria hyperparasitica TaxID=470096 RepID=A0A6A6VV40_9PEZI|nr:mannosyltransferase [Pseudovirgaria hyperparasitica]KAF2754035.1 mannosyltransferase [Pseudovirgaria hyperparasitica]